MATLATILRKFDAAQAPPRRAQAPNANVYQLRALPNEDIFFYTKRVDNSRLVREPDPRAKSECWSSIGAICAIAAVLITPLVPRVAGRTAGYPVGGLGDERGGPLHQRRRRPEGETRVRTTQRR